MFWKLDLFPETDPVPETWCSSTFRISDDGQSLKNAIILSSLKNAIILSKTKEFVVC
jgi:hypothetical protein